MLNEVSQTETDKYWMIYLHVEYKNYNKLVTKTKKPQRSRLRNREHTSGHQWGEGRKGGHMRVGGKRQLFYRII